MRNQTTGKDFAETDELVAEVDHVLRVTLPLTRDDDDDDTEDLAVSNEPSPALEIHLVYGRYPEICPSRMLVTNAWKKDELRNAGAGEGSLLHVELARFVASSLPKGAPMIFELFGFVEERLRERRPRSGDDVPSPLSTNDDVPVKKTNKSSKKQRSKPAPPSRAPRPRLRPRVRDVFWSTPPRDAPPAVPVPSTVSAAIARARRSLPAHRARDEFLDVLARAERHRRVLLVTGETGCGKTTQVPQFLLERYPDAAKIVVAQPRRLAATGVSARVAEERGDDGTVGHAVRGEVRVSDKTRLLFCTTGVLLRRLQSEDALEGVTHVVVDEVHERHLDTDVLLAVLKEALPRTPHLHVLLMSATMDADRFAAYWNPGDGVGGGDIPRMHIPGFTHPVQDHSLDHVLSLTGYVPPKKGKAKNDNAIDYNLLATLICHVVQHKDHDDDGSILVFLPGAPEIGQAERVIKKLSRNDSSLSLLPLHGGLQPKDQRRVFVPARRGVTKIVLSTNVAETSITIPDVTVVVDTCREKQSSFDPVNRMPMLVERYASLDSLRQRRGRAGRVRPGTCYKLLRQSKLDSLPAHGEPEIRRCALDQTLLSLMFLGVEDGTGKFLRTTLDPPEPRAIDAASRSLRRLGAIADDGAAGGAKQKLTPLGSHLAGIPAPPTVGKLLVVGSLLGCRSASLAVAAGMTVGRSPFLKLDVFQNDRKKPPRRRDDDEDEEDANDEAAKEKAFEEARQQRVVAARSELLRRVGHSDHAMLAAAYAAWNDASSGEKRRYCESVGVSVHGMQDMRKLVQQLDSSLSSIGFRASAESDANANSWRVLRSCVVAALAPSHVVRIHRPSTKYTETVDGAVEKDGVARELKFYVRDESTTSEDEQPRGCSSSGKHTYHGTSEERVFVHPSSAVFKVGNYGFPWLVYHELVRTSKPFLRDATECNPYALLMFGGAIDIQASNGLIVVDDWVRLSANARIGALIGGLRCRVDELLKRKVANPKLDVGTVEMKLIVEDRKSVV